MSIFYNLSKNATRDAEEELRFDSDEGNELLLDRQSDYQVGVVRFKIPMSKVPLFRVYRNDLHLNILGGNLGNGSLEKKEVYYRVDNFFGNDEFAYRQHSTTVITPLELHSKIIPPTPGCIYNNKGLYGYDDRMLKTYVDIFSHTQFTELLNNALAKSIVMNEARRNNELGNSNKYLLGTNYSGQQALKIVLDRHISVLKFPAGVGIVDGDITVPKSAIAGVPNGFIMTDFSLEIANFNHLPLRHLIPTAQQKTNGQNGYSNGNFKDLKFYLCRGLAVAGAVMDDALEYYPLITNILDGYDGIDPAISLDSEHYSILIALRSGHNIDAQTQRDTSLFRAHIGQQHPDGGNLPLGTLNPQNYKDYKYPFRLYPSATDFTGLLGQRIDNCSAKPYATDAQIWSIVIVNDTYAPTYGTPIPNPSGGTPSPGFVKILPVPYEFDAGQIKITMKGTHLQCLYGEEEYKVPTANPTYDLTFPQFKYDRVLNQIYLSRTSFWDTHYNLRILMNNKLKTLCSFGEYLVSEISETFYNRHFYTGLELNTPGYATNVDGASIVELLKYKTDYQGAVYNFPSRIESQGTDEDLGGKSGASQYNSLTPVKHYEAFDTTYSRNWVDSILFISGSIATQGEVVGNGGAVLKVITDFVLDPATNVRDYLTFRDNGNIRYYPMKTIGALFKVDVFVRFKDIYGNIRPLNIEPNSVASIKIEFRPNNMIQYYPQ